MSDLISRQAAIDALANTKDLVDVTWTDENDNVIDSIEEKRNIIANWLEKVPPAQPDSNKYEYHYDHTDCIWYRPEARNRCPVTCAQYRDGWNDAMNYIFRDGKGYRPYKRDEEYGE